MGLSLISPSPPLAPLPSRSDPLSAAPVAEPDPARPDAAWERRFVDAWAAERVGLLDATERAALEGHWPDWRHQAANLIAEGLLAYVALEMVAPDLAIATAEGRTHDTDDAELALRLGAHLRDFVDYRGLTQLARQTPTGPPTGPAP